jgi:hypothetical protein
MTLPFSKRRFHFQNDASIFKTTLHIFKTTLPFSKRRFHFQNDASHFQNDAVPCLVFSCLVLPCLGPSQLEQGDIVVGINSEVYTTLLKTRQDKTRQDKTRQDKTRHLREDKRPPSSLHK